MPTSKVQQEIFLDVEHVNTVIRVACETSPSVGVQLSMVAGALVAMCKRYQVSEANCLGAIRMIFDQDVAFLDEDSDVAGHA